MDDADGKAGVKDGWVDVYPLGQFFPSSAWPVNFALVTNTPLKDMLRRAWSEQVLKCRDSTLYREYQLSAPAHLR